MRALYLIPFSYPVLVVVPSAILAVPYLYSDEKMGGVSLFTGLAYLVMLTYFFIGNVLRGERLKEIRRAMQDYDGDYVLLLRSFERSEGYQTVSTDEGQDGWATPPIVRSEVGIFEAAVRAKGLRLVAMGGDFSLPARHRLLWLTCKDADWQRNVEHLAAGAKGILICPETTGGIKHELDLLVSQGHITKTVFYMAPSADLEAGRGEEESRRLRWESIREEAKKSGLRLPEYSSSGMFFTLGPDLRIAATAAVDLDPSYGKGFRWTQRAVARDTAMLERAGSDIVGLLRKGTKAKSFSTVLTRLELDDDDRGFAGYAWPRGVGMTNHLAWLAAMGAIGGIFLNLMSVTFTFAPEWLVFLLIGDSIVAMLGVKAWEAIHWTIAQLRDADRDRENRGRRH